MGSVNTPAPAPPVRQVIRVVYPKSPATPAAPDSPQEPELSDEERQAESRRDNLLRRNRGRFGTILSGFRGILSQSEASGRKTLLGE